MSDGPSMTDVAVVPKFYTGSDHRLLRGRFSFTRKEEKAVKFRERNPETVINWDLFATLAGFWEDFAMDNIDEEYDRLVEQGDPHDIGNYRPMCLLSVIYKLFTRVILNRIEKVLEEGQPCEQTGFRKGTIDHIHAVSKKYKMPLCLTFIDLKKSFDSVETEAVVEALDN
ncbi:hypothetical protein RB195_004449 [Necator americanus]|uniref:Reverse transcriptase domain-containing protein n=1 Tax=Necator americanus TaxID=51031 RepID=A0ABR1BI10_NECAM